MTRHLIRIAPLVVVGLVIGAQPALAGPPLLCHPFDIGSARSLPWNDTGAWWNGRSDYDVRNLVADTQALLTPATPVIVRMETLRRAAIYASRDAHVATQLLRALNDRAQREGGAGNGEPLAPFDAGYLTETLRQISLLAGETEFRTNANLARQVIGSADGYPLVSRSLSLRPDDPALDFAAALMTRGTQQSRSQQHAAKARRGVSQDALLARNIKQLS